MSVLTFVLLSMGCSGAFYILSRHIERTGSQGNPVVAKTWFWVNRIAGILFASTFLVALILFGESGMWMQMLGMSLAFFVIGTAMAMRTSGKLRIDEIEAILADPTRPFVLFLRPHLVDSTPADRTLTATAHEMFGVFLGRLEARTFAELLAPTIRQHGPLVGLYRDSLPPAGLIGMRINDERDWQREIGRLALASNCKCIVIHEGLSPNLRAEWDYVRRTGNSAGVFMATHPRHRRGSWTEERTEMSKLGVSLPEIEPLAGSLIAFKDWSSPVVLLEGARGGEEYAAAMTAWMADPAHARVVDSSGATAVLDTGRFLRTSLTGPPTEEVATQAVGVLGDSLRLFRVLDFAFVTIVYLLGCAVAALLLTRKGYEGVESQWIVDVLLVFAFHATVLSLVTCLANPLEELHLSTRLVWSMKRSRAGLPKLLVTGLYFLVPTILVVIDAVFGDPDPDLIFGWAFLWTLLLVVCAPSYLILKGVDVGGRPVLTAAALDALRSARYAIEASAKSSLLLGSLMAIAVAIIGLFSEGHVHPRSFLAQGMYFALAVAWATGVVTWLLRGGLAAVRFGLVHAIRARRQGDGR